MRNLFGISFWLAFWRSHWCLVFAFAVPDASSGEQPSAQSEKAAGEEKTLIENPTKEKPAIEKPASENTPKAPSDNSWTAGMTGDGATEDGSAKESESSSPLETFGAVLQAEGELAFENTTGIGVQSDYDSDLDRSYNTYDKYTAKVALIAPPLGTTAN